MLVRRVTGHAAIDLHAQRAYLGVHVGDPAPTFRSAELQLEFLLDFLGRDAIAEDVVLADGRWVGSRLQAVRDEPTTLPLPGGTLLFGLDIKTTGDRRRDRGIARTARAIVELDTHLSPLAWVASYVAPFSPAPDHRDRKTQCHRRRQLQRSRWRDARHCGRNAVAA